MDFFCSNRNLILRQHYYLNDHSVDMFNMESMGNRRHRSFTIDSFYFIEINSLKNHEQQPSQLYY